MQPTLHWLFKRQQSHNHTSNYHHAKHFHSDFRIDNCVYLWVENFLSCTWVDPFDIHFGLLPDGIPSWLQSEGRRNLQRLSHHRHLVSQKYQNSSVIWILETYCWKIWSETIRTPQDFHQGSCNQWDFLWHEPVPSLSSLIHHYIFRDNICG